MGIEKEGEGQLREGLEGMHLSYTSEQISRLLSYLSLLLAANQRMNLTAIRVWEEAIHRHLLDSASLLTKASLRKGKRVVDIGTGGGLPGMVLAILCPEATFVLVDATGKKVAFLQETLKTLGITNAIAQKGRAEELGRDTEYRERFDMAVARAVAPLSVLAEYAIPLVKKGGTFFAYKGEKAEEERGQAQNAYRLLGCSPPQLLPVQGTRDSHLALIGGKKIAHTPSQYPRPGGTPRKNPL